MRIIPRYHSKDSSSNKHRRFRMLRPLFITSSSRLSIRRRTSNNNSNMVVGRRRNKVARQHSSRGAKGDPWVELDMVLVVRMSRTITRRKAVLEVNSSNAALGERRS